MRFDWAAMAFVAAGTVPGIAAVLRRGFAAFLVIMAAFIFFENIGPLSAVSRGH